MAEKKNYDSDFCGSLPMHNINLIQDYGYLLVLDKNTLDVIQVSENASPILGKSVQEAVNTPLSAYINDDDLKRLKEITDKEVIGDKIPFSLTLTGTGQKVLALLHAKPGYIVLELEKTPAGGERYFTNVFQDIKVSMGTIEKADSVQKVCDAAIHEIKKVSGFDGALMYQFDEDWNGTVVAEEKDPRLEPYMGQKFPASDIPKQARELYLKNPYRLIPSRSFTPVRLYPVINPVTKTFIDLTDCNLRSVPAVHLEYMKNMGIEASMSVRVIRNGKLWGLISCHNIEPKYLSYEVCSVLELLSTVISNKISAILNKEDFDFGATLQQKRALLVENIYAAEDISKGIINDAGDQLLGLFNATGAAVIVNGRTETIGKTPDTDALDNLALWLESKSVDKVFSTSHLSDLYDEAAEYADVASGMLVVPVNSSRSEYVICFRPEVIQTIDWGGNPDEAITFEPDGKNYHPRNSFKLWQQRVEQNAQPWHKDELDVAETLRSFLFEFRTKQLYN